jgi:hypothetical protein
MKAAALFFFVTAAAVLHAQPQSAVKVDTVQPGFYVAPDSGWQSLTVSVCCIGSVAVDQYVAGNELPAEVVLLIISQDTGSRIVYSEQRQNGKTGRRYEYVIGGRNSVAAMDARGETITVTANALAEIELDTDVLAFAIHIVKNGKAVLYAASGNKIPEQHKAEIRALEPGQKVYFEMLLVRRPDGSTYRIPRRTYIITD